MPSEISVLHADKHSNGEFRVEIPAQHVVRSIETHSLEYFQSTST